MKFLYKLPEGFCPKFRSRIVSIATVATLLGLCVQVLCLCLLCRTTSSFRLTLVGLFNQARRGLASSFHCCIDVVHVLGMKPGFLEHDVDVDQRRNRTTLSMLVKSMKIQSFPLCPALRFGRAVGLRPTGCVNVRTNSSEHIASHGVNCFRAFLTVMLCLSRGWLYD